MRVTMEFDAEEVVGELDTSQLIDALRDRGQAPPDGLDRLADELYIAMSTGHRERQDSICRTLVYELAGRII